MADVKLQLVRSPLPAQSVDWRAKQYGKDDGDRHMTVAEARIAEHEADAIVPLAQAFNASADALAAAVPQLVDGLAARFGVPLGVVRAAIDNAVPGDGPLRLLIRVFPND